MHGNNLITFASTHLVKDARRVLIALKHEESQSRMLVHGDEGQHVRRKQLVLVRNVDRLQHLDAYSTA